MQSGLDAAEKRQQTGHVKSQNDSRATPSTAVDATTTNQHHQEESVPQPPSTSVAEHGADEPAMDAMDMDTAYGMMPWPPSDFKFLMSNTDFDSTLPHPGGSGETPPSEFLGGRSRIPDAATMARRNNSNNNRISTEYWLGDYVTMPRSTKAHDDFPPSDTTGLFDPDLQAMFSPPPSAMPWLAGGGGGGTTDSSNTVVASPAPSPGAMMDSVPSTTAATQKKADLGSLGPGRSHLLLAAGPAGSVSAGSSSTTALSVPATTSVDGKEPASSGGGKEETPTCPCLQHVAFLVHELESGVASEFLDADLALVRTRTCARGCNLRSRLERSWRINKPSPAVPKLPRRWRRYLLIPSLLTYVCYSHSTKRRSAMRRPCCSARAVRDDPRT